MVGKLEVSHVTRDISHFIRRSGCESALAHLIAASAHLFCRFGGPGGGGIFQVFGSLLPASSIGFLVLMSITFPGVFVPHTGIVWVLDMYAIPAAQRNRTATASATKGSGPSAIAIPPAMMNGDVPAPESHCEESLRPEAGGAGNILDRHIRINTMLIEKVDVIGAKPLERPLDRQLDVLGLAVETRAPLTGLEGAHVILRSC